MAGITRRAWLTSLVSAPVLGGVAAWTRHHHDKGNVTRGKTKTWQQIPARDLIRKRHLPNVELITHEGKKVRFYDDLVKGRKIVINFMYAACDGICVPVTENLKRARRLLGDRVGRDIFFYSITLKPEEDTPDVLKHYTEMHRTGPDWLFLTGNPEDIELLRASLGYKYDDPIEDADKSNHVGMVRFGNEPTLQWGACPGQADARWLAESILIEVDERPQLDALAKTGA